MKAVVALVAAAAGAAATPHAVVKAPIPAPTTGKVYVFTVRETLKPGVTKPHGIRLSVLNDKALGNVSAAGGVSKPTVKGRVATYKVLVGVINWGSRRVQGLSPDAVDVGVAAFAQAEAFYIVEFEDPTEENCQDLAADLHILVTYYGLRNHTYQPSPAVQVLREAYLRDCP